MAKTTREVWVMFKLEPNQALMPLVLQRYECDTCRSYILNVVIIWKHGQASSVLRGGGAGSVFMETLLNDRELAAWVRRLRGSP